MSHSPVSPFRHLWFIALICLGACAHQDSRPLAPAPESGTDKVYIHTLPVGAGNCQLLQCPSQNRLIMFDCGSTGAGDLGWSAEKVKDYVDNLIDPGTEIIVSLSHSDSDHGNYLPTVFPERKIKNILLGGNPDRYVSAVREWIAKKKLGGATVKDWWPKLYHSAAPEEPLSCWVKNSTGGWDVDVAGYILAVNAGSSPNSNSMVVASQYNRFLAVFTGDMTGDTQAQIDPTDPVDLSNTRFITGAHHGADTQGSNDESWAAWTQPQAIVFSAGDKHQHPRCSSVDNYLPYLEAAPEHRYHCGLGGSDGYEERTTKQGILVTDDNGLIIARGSSTGSADISWSVEALYTSASAKPGLLAKPAIEVISRGCAVDDTKCHQ